MFTDVEFMTAKEKELVLKNWQTFLKHGLQRKHFTKRLYNHLHLHCGFIAHYNLGGFYSTYFEAGEDTERFFKHFCIHSAQNYGANIDYDDLHTAMREVYSKYQGNIEKQTEDDVAERLKLLGAVLNMPKMTESLRRNFSVN